MGIWGALEFIYKIAFQEKEEWREIAVIRWVFLCQLLQVWPLLVPQKAYYFKWLLLENGKFGFYELKNARHFVYVDTLYCNGNIFKWRDRRFLKFPCQTDKCLQYFICMKQENQYHPLIIHIVSVDASELDFNLNSADQCSRPCKSNWSKNHFGCHFNSEYNYIWSQSVPNLICKQI